MSDDLLASSKKRLQVADHFLTQTYPLLKEPKLLVSVLDNVTKAYDELMTAAFADAKHKGLVADALGDAAHVLFNGPVGERYGITRLDLHMGEEMRELASQRKASMLEFPRKGKLVMADDEYSLATISPEKVKTYLNRTKRLHTAIHDSIRTPRRH